MSLRHISKTIGENNEYIEGIKIERTNRDGTNLG